MICKGFCLTRKLKYGIPPRDAAERTVLIQHRLLELGRGVAPAKLPSLMDTTINSGLEAPGEAEVHENDGDDGDDNDVDRVVANPAEIAQFLHRGIATRTRCDRKSSSRCVE